MYVEINEELFNKIVTSEVTCESVEQKEFCYIELYIVEGVVIKVIHNYVSGVWQYYIQDINA